MRIFIVALTAWLGLLWQPAFGQTELIVNGGFESSAASIAPWQIVASPSTANNVLSAAGAYGGSSECLLLGVGNNYSQDVYQTVTFPSNLISATLSFYYNVVTTDLNTSQDATLYIELQDSNHTQLVPPGGPVSNLTPTGGYTPYSAQFVTAAGSVFAGKVVTFHFLANTLNVFGGYTAFFIDNVSIQIATTADIPANDNFTNAAVITGAAATWTANNSYASKETGEPNHAGNAGGHSLWWRWVAPSNGIVALKATGTAFQPLLAAYTGAAVSQLTAVAANTANPAQISFKAVAGTTYYLAVDGYNGGTGGMLLSLGFASDVTAPLVTITAPLPGANVTNSSVLVKGTASDNLAVAQVQYRLENPAGTNDYQTATGTNAWSATVSNLSPGYNVIRVRALDTSSNYSATVTRTIDYLVGSPITLLVNGGGRITGATNGQSLNLGNAYSLTAVPTPGYAFAGWNGDVYGSLPKVTFTMRSNLTLRANFVDITRPTLSITNIPLGGNVSNSLFTLRGKAGDNQSVTNVAYNFNNAGWTSASPSLVNDWTNWFADLQLIPGNNVVSAYAVDAAGNRSLTNTVKFVYVLSAPLTVSTNGQGSIRPSLNGALLQIGKNYSLTATPATGFGFANWTDAANAVVTNKPVLNFLMASNLAFTANFTDITRPTVNITNIPVGGNVSNRQFIVKGRAGDNVALAGVSYRLNQFDWTPANPDYGWTNWSASLDLTPGTNFISTYAVDTTGNVSLTNTARVVYIVSAPLTVSTNGKGSIVPALNGAWLPIGKNFTLTATAAAGFAFANWTDAGGTQITNKPALTFLMASNLAFTANFVDIAKPVLAITNVAIGQHWSNSQFVVRGTAADNAAVTNVFYNLNQNGWVGATTTNAWSNWYQPLTLNPGTNVVSAYAVDSSGNASATNTVKLLYVVSALVHVQITEGGAVTPNYDGHLLALGGNYSMRAVNTNGFWFSYWSGDVPMTTNVTVNFNLASNTTIIANFRDGQRPTNTILFPAANQNWSAPFITAAGQANDNFAVADVWVRVNGGDWTEATTANGFASWTSTNLPVNFDTNLVESFAVDLDGNLSLTNRVTFIGFYPNDGMLPVPGGTYTVGDLLDDYANYNLTGDSPTNVLLSAFFMDTNLVSYSQWQSVYNWATNHGYRFDTAGAGKGPDHPVQMVSWYDALKWCNARSLKSRLTPVYYADTNYASIYTNGHAASVYANWSANGYRLPTEAEWETAARGGWTGTLQQHFPWSDHIDWTLANYIGNPGLLATNGFYYDYASSQGYDPEFNDGVKPYTNPVGASPNGYGLNDMAGNVNQWCWDWYGTPYGQPTTNNPTGPASGIYRVVRGGSWNAMANEARCAYRGKQSPTVSTNTTGFRCVRRD